MYSSMKNLRQMALSLSCFPIEKVNLLVVAPLLGRLLGVAVRLQVLKQLLAAAGRHFTFALAQELISRTNYKINE